MYLIMLIEIYHAVDGRVETSSLKMVLKTGGSSKIVLETGGFSKIVLKNINSSKIVPETGGYS